MDSLDTLLTSLVLQPPSEKAPPTRFDTFTLFPTLPLELRLKILQHALPTCSTLKLRAEVQIADPSFGLYLTFTPTRTLHNKQSSFLSSSTPLAISQKETRNLGVLGACKQSRELYLTAFPLALPTGPRGRGVVRYAASEIILLANIRELVGDADFQDALRGGYRVQAFWGEVRHLGIPAEMAVGSAGPLRLVHVIRCFWGLSGVADRTAGVNVFMWEGFEDEVAERAVREAMGRRVKVELTDEKGMVPFMLV